MKAPLAAAPVAAPATARARARAELTREIAVTARRHLAELGAAGLSLRAVARELGMSSSAVYRYYASRDELLTALIIESYDAVGEVAERAAAGTRGGPAKRFAAVAVAIRAWAVANPHDYALVYGTPVPGYVAPRDTVPAAARVSIATLQIFVDGVASGDVATASTGPVPRTVKGAFQRIRDEAAPGLPDEVISRVLLAWTNVFGSISFELFGHLHGIVEDYDTFFDHQVARMARLAVTGTE